MNITDEIVRDIDLTEIDFQRKKQKQDKEQLKLLRSWLASHFQGCRTASITIHLKRGNHHARFTQTNWKIEQQADHVATLFYNQLNEHLYGKAFRRYGKHVRFCASLHIEGGNPHLHIVSEIPKDRDDLEIFKAFVEGFCVQPSMLKEVNGRPYVDETRHNYSALQYNNDNTKCRDFVDIDGTESLRLFR